jgi:hypothetical protein
MMQIGMLLNISQYAHAGASATPESGAEPARAWGSV